jgi:hypothetical protein
LGNGETVASGERVETVITGAFFLRQIKRPLTNNVESEYLTLVKTNLGSTHQGIEGCGWSGVSARRFGPVLGR